MIEANPQRAELVADRLKRAVVLRGDARDRRSCEEANIAAAARPIVTVTNDDEVNIMAAVLAKRLGCGRAMALVNNSTYNVISGRSASTSRSTRATPRFRASCSHVRRGRIKAVHAIADGEAEIFEAEALETSPLVGRPLREVRLPGGLIVGAIVRGKEIVMPRADSVVQAHDRV